MSVNAILSSALSGLQAAQAGMRTTSSNITNVNTPGYAREEVDISSQTVGGMGVGVRIEGVRRVTDAFLVAASLGAASRATAADVRLELLDRTQAAFGDPTSGASVFSTLNQLFSSLAEVAADPSSAVRRAGSVADLNATLAEFERLSVEIQSVRGEADSRISHAVGRVNDLLQEIGRLNGDLAVVSGGVTSGAENALAQVMDELSQLIDVRLIRQPSGAVEVRTQDGVLLVGHSVATLSYSGTGIATPGNVYSPIQVQLDGAPPLALDQHLRGGELRGLLDVRDRELPAIAESLGEFAAGTADALNRAHSGSTSYPPKNTLTGRDTGLLAADQHNFTGATTLTVLGADGTLQHTIEIDFDAGSVVLDGVPAAFSGTTVGSVVADINAALVATGGSAAFTNGALTLTAGAGEGLAFVEDAAAPSARGGRTFAHFFGVNDLVTSASPLFFETGLTAADPHGFTAGQTFELRLQDVNGSTLREASFTMAGAPNNTLGDVLTALNDVATGLGAFGTFAFDGDGELQFTPAVGFDGAEIKVKSDETQRGGTSRTFTQLFGVGDGPRAVRALGMIVRSDIDANPALLALGKIDLVGANIGDIVTGTGDGAGGIDLQAAGSRPRDFDAAGGFPAMTSTVLDYAGRVAGDAGRRANAAAREQVSAAALRTEADQRRGSVEGVNLEEELVKLTTFQQSFNAASRLIQAAKEMGDMLINMV